MKTEDKSYWLVEGGPVSAPIYACAEIRDGRPVFSFNPYGAAKFNTEGGAMAWREELALDDKWRIAEHILA